VLYGKNEHQYDQRVEGTVTNYTFYDYKSGYIHHCLVDGLEVLDFIFFISFRLCILYLHTIVEIFVQHYVYPCKILK
jgi:hypothetical protein